MEKEETVLVRITSNRITAPVVKAIIKGCKELSLSAARYELMADLFALQYAGPNAVSAVTLAFNKFRILAERRKIRVKK